MKKSSVAKVLEVQIRSAKGSPGSALAINMKNAPGSGKGAKSQLVCKFRQKTG